jgi:hypothetical protein
MKNLKPFFIIAFFITLFITTIVFLPKGTEFKKYEKQQSEIKNYKKTFKND